MGKKIEHKVIDGIEYKWCYKCKQWKPLSEFSKDKTRKDGLQPYCKECNKRYMKQYYVDNAEARRQYSKQYHAANRDEHIEKMKQYNADNYATLEWYAYNIRLANLQADRKYGRIGAEEDPLPTIEQYIELLQQPDYYDKKQYPFNEMELDRIDNSKPHTFANVVPCSTANNRRRHFMPFEEFCELMRKEKEWVQTHSFF